MKVRGFCWYLFSLLLFLATIASIITSIYTIVKAYEASQIACQCMNGTDGLPGTNDSCQCCPNSEPHFSTQSINTIVGSAQYVNTRRNPGNNNRGNGDPLRLQSPPIFNDIPGSISDFITSSGTIFNLTLGTYELVYGTSLTTAGSLCIYNGSSTGSMNPLLESMIGSQLANVWLHGNYILQCNSLPCYFKLAPYNSSTLVVAVAPSLTTTTGAMVQISILKLY